MKRLQLHDQVTITRAGGTEAEGTPVPAMVYFTTTALAAGTGSLYATEEARAIVTTLPWSVSPSNTSVYWQGRRYTLSGPPMPRMRRGRLHHYTLPLQRTTET